MDHRADMITEIVSDDFPHPLPPLAPGGTEEALETLREVEKRHIDRVLRQVRGNQRAAARILGISRWSLARRLRRYGVPPRFSRAAATA